ncbi:MAG: T9SS type A sorting domain-containing protein [Bacteroidales bacterium]|nr:T9SS type A sorting domain-containing protein [Bacteroidales bacterium]
MILLLVGVMTNLFSVTALHGQQLAFPTAEGSGRFSTGGRGGDVYAVTNLNNSGPGSIVDAVSSGNRTIVFRVSGTIALGDVILRPKSNTTIAGQTAPGDGICIKGRIYIGSVSDVIIRYIRVRVDAGAANSSGDAIDIAGGTNIIIDHVSASYARDEGISCQPNSNKVTVQWCIISEALTFENHGYGSLVRGDYGDEKTFHHNLYAHNQGRNPRPGNYTGSSSDPEGLHFDFRNNVVYNYGGSKAGYNADKTSVSRYNFVGNAYIRGPESSGNLAFRESSVVAYGYFRDNSMEGVVPENPWTLVGFDGFTTAQKETYQSRSYEVSMEPVITTSPEQAKTDVLARAGASLPRRDTIDKRLVIDVLNKTGHSIATVNDQPEGGWPELYSEPAPADDDGDGMPNDWEIRNGLDKDNPDDRNTIRSGGYTNLEIYLNSLTEENANFQAPSNLSAELLDVTKVKITWEDNTDTESGFRIERSEGSVDNFITIAEVNANSTMYVDSLLKEETHYYYRVFAFNESQLSGFDGVASVVTLGATSLPQEIGGPLPEDNAMIVETLPALRWNQSINADNYDVYFGSNDPPAFKFNQSDTVFYPEKLEKGTTYYWRIDAKNGFGTTTGRTWSFYVKEGINAGQIAHWKLDETTGAIAADSGPFKLDGELLNMNPVGWYTGKVNGGLLFDGVDDVMRVAHKDVLILSDESFSISLWLYTQDLSETSMVLFEKGSFFSNDEQGTNGRWFVIETSGDALRFVIDDNNKESAVVINDVSNLLPYKWTHIVAIRDAEERMLKLYVNGALQSGAADETGSISQTDDLYIGNNQSGTGPFYGILDEIKMYNYALSNAEVKAVYGTSVDVPVRIGDELNPVKNYPNPFSSSTTFEYNLASENDVTLYIYSLSGRRLSTLVDQRQTAGTHSLTFDAVGMESGIYLYELRIGSKGYRGKMIIMK